MLDINDLDTSLSYIGGVYNKGLLSKDIQFFEPKFKDIKNQWSHTFALIFEDGKPYIYESHLKWHGVKKIPFDEWQKDYNLNCVECYARDFNKDVLDYFVRFNPGYSIADIGEDALNKFLKSNKLPDTQGIDCSEYMARAVKGQIYCYNYNLPANLIEPVHIQAYEIEDQRKVA